MIVEILPVSTVCVCVCPVSGTRTQELWKASLELWTQGCRSQEGCVYHSNTQMCHNRTVPVDKQNMLNYINNTKTQDLLIPLYFSS